MRRTIHRARVEQAVGAARHRLWCCPLQLRPWSSLRVVVFWEAPLPPQGFVASRPVWLRIIEEYLPAFSEVEG